MSNSAISMVLFALGIIDLLIGKSIESSIFLSSGWLVLALENLKHE
jgi:hypothetical protein